MNKYTTQQLNDLYQKLPEDLKEIIASVDSTAIIQEIGKDHGLHIDQLGELGSETGYVLMGITAPTQFVTNLTSRLKIDRLIANTIANDINEKIFSKVRESLKKIQTENKEIGPTAKEILTGIPAQPGSQIHQQIKDETLSAIEKPESVVVTSKFPGTATSAPKINPVITQYQKNQPITTPAAINILEEKMKNSINIPKSETVVKNLPTDTPVRLSQIKSKPATDPYRETL